MASDDEKGRKRWLMWEKTKNFIHLAHLVHTCRAALPLFFFVFQGITGIGGPSAASWSGAEFIVRYRGKQGPTNAK